VSGPALGDAGAAPRDESIRTTQLEPIAADGGVVEHANPQ
jgi:hypothetical protein